MALEEKEIPDDFTINGEIANAIQNNLKDGKLPCARAFRIANRLDVPPLAVGKNADALQIHLSHCQLGLFGYGHEKAWQGTSLAKITNPEELKGAIQARRNDDGALPCRAAWDVAEAFSVSRMQVGYFADQLGIRIVACQLGAF